MLSLDETWKKFISEIKVRQKGQKTEEVRKILRPDTGRTLVKDKENKEGFSQNILRQ